jgi:ribonuclease HIII
VARLDPPEYNAAHARLRNLNPLLAELHANVIAQLATPGMRVVVDQFAADGVLRRALAGQDVALEQRPRAESAEVAVAAASLIAREEFVRALAELSETWGIDLAKGAGAPTDRAARRFVALHGADKLGEVAKLHFRTTAKITGGGPP